jgi:HD-like signal output (HDOD) protein
LFETLLERVGKGELQVPNMPEVPAKLRELLRTDPDIVEVAKLLRQDASLCARVIGVANSAYYGSFKTSHTIEQAVSTLGLNATWRHVELAANRNLYTLGDNRYRALLKPLWVHAAACAELCRAIALETRLVEPDVAFTMGLLHDIGHLFLIQLVAEADAEGGIEAPPGEQAMARFLAEYHAAFGARILELWKLPPEYATVARRHEQPTADGDGAAAARVVHLADLMSARIGFGDRDKAPLEAELDAVAASLALPQEKLRDMERDVAKLLGEI